MDKHIITINVNGLPNTGKSVIISRITKLFTELGFDTEPHYQDGIYRTYETEMQIIGVIKNRTKIQVIEGQYKRSV